MCQNIAKGFTELEMTCNSATFSLLSCGPRGKEKHQLGLQFLRQ